MIIVDVSKKADPGPAIAFAAKARDHRVFVVAELPRDAVEVEGHHYVGRVGVTTDPERLPPPRPKPKRPEPTLDEERERRKQEAIAKAADDVEQEAPSVFREGAYARVLLAIVDEAEPDAKDISLLRRVARKAP